MAAVTVSGVDNGTTINFAASSPAQITLAQQILGALNATSTLITGGFQSVSGTAVIAGTGTIGTGSATSLSSVALVGQADGYVTGVSPFSQVVAADNTNSVIVNNNPNGTLVADTGAGSNTLVGLAGYNTFTTGANGNDAVILNGTSNVLNSGGNDVVLVGGPSTITAASTATDNITMTNATTLNFINGSKAGVVDSVTGANGSIITLAGSGATSVTAGVGSAQDVFNVDTSAGNVTLNNNLSSTSTIEFLKNANTGTANDVVNNFATGDSVLVHGYAGFNVTASASNPAGSVLVLSDGSQVTFSNVSVATLQQTVKVV